MGREWHGDTIEGASSLLKRGTGGFYHGVATMHPQTYSNTYAFRYNNRAAGGREYSSAILDRGEKAPLEASGDPGVHLPDERHC